MLRLKSGIMTDDVREFIEEVVRGGVWKILRWGALRFPLRKSAEKIFPLRKYG
jgi:hypothetical protein